MIGNVLAALLPKVFDVVGEVVEDKDLKQKLEHQIKFKMMTNEHELNKTATDIVLAEAGSKHWLTSTWRPALMWLFIIIIGMNYLVIPIANWFAATPIEYLMFPEQFWTLLQIGLGGYVVGRSGEKIAKEFRQR